MFYHLHSYAEFCLKFYIERNKGTVVIKECINLCTHAKQPYNETLLHSMAVLYS